MSFSFGFQLEEDGQSVTSNSANIGSNAQLDLHPWTEVALDDLIKHLPPALSYSSIDIPHTSSQALQPIPRRDLFDARFQLIEADQEQSIVSGDSDLVPGRYEGGLKTWECSIDLVQYLHESNADFKNKRIFEIGCGTSLPSLYAYRQVLQQPGSKSCLLHLQDYNLQTLQLVTFPNIFLTWYVCHYDKGSEGEVEVNDEVIGMFKKHLVDEAVELRFSYGAWTSIDKDYDYVLTSETVYRTESIPPLVDLMKSSTHSHSVILLASKGIYFGVGGGVKEFSDYVLAKGLTIDNVWTSKGVGVSRCILKVIL
ncbi:hypothetical protein E3P92_00410 [Wallemia ichthyophaga]|uniref:protein-histidine N-methyltransferase n=2 Tax=Wallemia ichthyophaga TaxID=245174 RepID=A0A4T0JHD1_WALIC|nr:Histidine protein methyltransferase 1 [Wallemia ichthyophaga EXF-994]TIA74910.1 hypothetical protein E3P91_00766 [Wallemia ichthyophaga]EOR00981.1 Histidine protein methyltransferase 1 [Wallemia ichthyophaga EXF-994]TIA81642.1 hypothetical protein E3P98_01946 [Wallemia ichthyophaga]TIA99948.1 hypothetical protein E3P96_02771 [Wallemia ichthyophaga]TIB03770.1 hypothetical protein E3P95_00476 [Wallemia ichthyophaga]